MEVRKTWLLYGTALCLSFFTCIAAHATDNAIRLTTGNGTTIEVVSITPNIIKVSNFAKNSIPRPEAPSLSTTLTLPVKEYEFTNGTSLNTSAGLNVEVNPLTGAVNISAPSMSISDTGLHEDENGKQQIKLYTGGGGSFYGAGERGHSFKLNGDTLVMYNRQNYGYTKGDPRISQMNITMPLFISSQGYAIVFDDYMPATMIMNDPIVYTSESPWPINYYVIYGNGNLPETSTMLSELIGRQNLPPLWALGYITSKYGYHTQEETLGVIDTLKTNGYPVDGIVLDLYWYGKEEDMGRLAWDKDQWPDPTMMLDSLKSQGVNLVAISQPYILSNGRGVENYRYLSENKMLALDSLGDTHPVTIWVGEGGMLDVSNPMTIEWLKNKYKELTETGITGWWGDLGEPEVHPETAFHHNMLSARQYHNRYGNDWSKIIYDLFKEDYADQRLMTLMRGGTTGLQQFNVFPWSTDVSRSWGGLQPQIIIMLNSGLSGLGYMSHDVGGFAIDPENPVDEELYIRWLQLGLFSPILRTHAQAMAEPYLYERQDIILPLIKDRYRWLPYNYSLAYENSLFALPLVRPIEYYSGSDSADELWDEYLWGRDVLVAPVLTQGVIARDIKLPEGTDKWIDLNNPTSVYEGGSIIKDYPAPLAVLPIFVREGAFIPSAPYPMGNTTDYRTDFYRIDYFPLENSESEYILYEDNLTTPNNEKNNLYAQIVFEGREVKGKIEITISSYGAYPGMNSNKILDIVVNGQTSKPKKVQINGNEAVFNFDSVMNTVSIPMDYQMDSTKTITIIK